MMNIVRVVVRVLALCLMLIAAVVTLSTLLLKRQVKHEVTALFANGKDAVPTVVTEADLAPLPEPVQRWLRHAGMVGKERARTVRLKQTGLFRQAADQLWMPYTAEQYYTVNPPAFIWSATMKAPSFLWIRGRDRYANGTGHLFFKLLSVIPVVDSRGPEMDQGALLRYLNETMWFPSAALSSYIHWEPVDANAARATMHYGDITASAIFYFNAIGELTNMVAQRYQDRSGGAVLETWSTPIQEYGEINGLRLPIKGTGVWNLTTGDLPYIQLAITDLEYNNASMY